MAGKMVKPYSLFLYLLSVLTFFVLGIMYAVWIDAGEGQMLAAGAIVLGYGVIGAFIGLCVSLLVAYRANRKSIIRIDIVLAILLIAFCAYFISKKAGNQPEGQQSTQPKIDRPATKPAEPVMKF